VTESPTNDGNNRRIMRQDLIDYVACGCDTEMRKRIDAQCKIEGSPVAREIETMMEKLRNPLDVDWKAIESLKGINENGAGKRSGETPRE